MMRLSTKGRYSARLMLELALHYGKGPVLLKDISKRQEISEGYLEHLLPPLKAAGLISSTRGAHGGYTLAKPPSEITLKDIVGATEGTIKPVECVDSSHVCRKTHSCVMRNIWKTLGENIVNTLDSFTLEDLIERQRAKEEVSLVYNI